MNSHSADLPKSGGDAQPVADWPQGGPAGGEAWCWMAPTPATGKDRKTRPRPEEQSKNNRRTIEEQSRNNRDHLWGCSEVTRDKGAGRTRTGRGRGQPAYRAIRGLRPNAATRKPKRAHDRFLRSGRPTLINTSLQRGGCGTRTSSPTASAVYGGG